MIFFVSNKPSFLFYPLCRASFWYNCWGVKPSEIVQIYKIFSKSRSSRMQDFLLLFLAQFSMRIMYYSGERKLFIVNNHVVMVSIELLLSWIHSLVIKMFILINFCSFLDHCPCRFSMKILKFKISFVLV